MGAGKKTLLVVLIAGIPISLLWVRHLRRQTVKLMGAVVIQNKDPRKELPIEGVQVTASGGVAPERTYSDSSGLFSFTFRKRLILRHPIITLGFKHSDYEPLRMHLQMSDQLIVAELSPVVQPKVVTENLPQQTITNVVVRYSIKTATEVNVGSAVRSFEVANKGNVPCNSAPPCSPDKKWKASSGSVTMDAGVGNEFRNARASCIAGPCPFTKMDTSELARPHRNVTVAATTWSDTATFMVEAEVVRPMVSDLVRNSYPVGLDNALNFTLPPAAQGVSLQADVNGQSIIFPLGPALILSWANCNARSNPDQTRVYRCEIKPGYRWRNPGN